MDSILILTPAQRRRLQLIVAMWKEMLTCEPSLEEPEDEELLAIIGTEDRELV